jgi:hypothetical protein
MADPLKALGLTRVQILPTGTEDTVCLVLTTLRAKRRPTPSIPKD